MNLSDIEAAEEKIRFAREEANNLRKKNIGPDEFYKYWTQFLTHQGDAFNHFHYLYKKDFMNNAAKAWWESKKYIQENDELLSYVRHARNAKTHGIMRVARKLPAAPPSIVIGVINGRFVAFNGNIPESTTLIGVQDGKDFYDIPSMHQGVQLNGIGIPSMNERIAYASGIAMPPNPIADLADLVVTYLEKLVAESKDYCD